MVGVVTTGVTGVGVGLGIGVGWGITTTGLGAAIYSTLIILSAALSKS